MHRKWENKPAPENRTISAAGQSACGGWEYKKIPEPLLFSGSGIYCFLGNALYWFYKKGALPANG